MKLAPLAGRLLLHLEEIGGGSVPDALNSATSGVADSGTLIEALACLDELERNGLVRYSLHEGDTPSWPRTLVPGDRSELRAMLQDRLCVNVSGWFRWAQGRTARVVAVEITERGLAEVRGG